MCVEKAQKSDIDALVELRIEYLKEDNGILDEDDAKILEQRLPEYFKVHLNKDMFAYVIREGTRIVSCAFLLIIEKPMSPSFINGKTGVVLNVFTCPIYRKKGYAKKIMGELLDDARERDLCKLELKSTDAGYPLYLSLGFKDDISKYHSLKWENDKQVGYVNILDERNL